MACAKKFAYPLRIKILNREADCELKACSVIKYSGKLTADYQQYGSDAFYSRAFSFYLLPPSTKVIFEEYIIRLELPLNINSIELFLVAIILRKSLKIIF